MDKTYDVVVIGAGHAGCEAALAAARLGMKTLVFSISLEAVANMLRMNDVSKLSMLENFYGSYNIPTDFLPKYVKAERQVFSLTDLLKKNNCEVKAVQFNKMLIDKGYLEERERQSSKGGVKKFKSITDKGLNYGENQKSPHNPRETQPLWYEDSFMELYYAIVG